jgi:hypothetical protein
MGYIALIVCGGVVSIFGVIFHLQGHSVLGPTSSFMYSNPQWVDYGMWIAICGILIILAGIGKKFLTKTRQYSK